MNPVWVVPVLQELQKCFDVKDVQMLQDTISKMDPTVSPGGVWGGHPEGPRGADPPLSRVPLPPPFAGGQVPHAALHRLGAVGAQRPGGRRGREGGCRRGGPGGERGGGEGEAVRGGWGWGEGGNEGEKCKVYKEKKKQKCGKMV